MKAVARSLSYEIQLGPEESLSLPAELAACIRGGTWIVSVRPKDDWDDEAARDHSSFLSGYSDEDEGLYDDAPSR